MSKRPPRPSGNSWLSPYLVVRDADAALAFYQKAFGLEKRMAIPGPGGKIAHAEILWHDVTIMMGVPHGTSEWPHQPPTVSKIVSPISLYLYCDDVDALYARAVAAGARGIKSPEDQFYGDRVCLLEDPDGYWWYFATNVADFDPSKTPG